MKPRAKTFILDNESVTILTVLMYKCAHALKRNIHRDELLRAILKYVSDKISDKKEFEKLVKHVKQEIVRSLEE